MENIDIIESTTICLISYTICIVPLIQFGLTFVYTQFTTLDNLHVHNLQGFTLDNLFCRIYTNRLDSFRYNFIGF